LAAKGHIHTGSFVAFGGQLYTRYIGHVHLLSTYVWTSLCV